MLKTLFAGLALAALSLASVPASATDFNVHGFGGAFVAGGAVSGTFGETFAKNKQSKIGNPNLKGYAQTEITSSAGAELQGGTNLPFRANVGVGATSLSGAGSMVNGVNGNVRNSTGGSSGAGAAIGAAAGFKLGAGFGH